MRSAVEITCKKSAKAWELIPDVKIRRAFEMRRDCAKEALENDGWCETGSVSIRCITSSLSGSIQVAG